MVKKDFFSKYSGVILLLGLVILGTFFYVGDSTSREVLLFDGVQDQFVIKLINAPGELVAGTEAVIKANVYNPASTQGSMYAQCAIFDRLEQTWIPKSRSTNLALDAENCVSGETFSSTKTVTLNPGEDLDLEFSLVVPKNVDGDNVIYCEVYEECYSVNQNPMSSSMDLKEVRILPASEDTVIAVDDKSFLEDNINYLLVIGIILTLLGFVFTYNKRRSSKRFFRK